jgi:LysM repeat protein
VPAVEVTKDDIGIILPTDTEEPIVVPPTETPLPTATAVPSDTPVPTATPIPTETQEPSPTQEVPTDGIIPTATLVRLPTATPVGGDVAPISDTFPGTIIHTVRAGDTVGELATLYGSSTGAIIEANGLNSSALIFRGQGLVIPVRLAAPATSTPTATPVVVVVTATLSPPPDNIYVVQPGDTLTRIALRFNTTVATLAQLNGIVNANQIQVGQRIAVPVPEVAAPDAPSVAAPVTIEPVTYVVQPGDNLFRIALRFGVSMQQLAIENGIVNMNRVFIGQVLVIPV